MPQFSYKSFAQLSTLELHTIYALRAKVFVVEQHCPYQDIDGTDITCFHLQLLNNQNLIAYARVIPPDDNHNYCKIGRVLTAPEQRGKSFGRAIMQEAIVCCKKLYMHADIVISAQAYLVAFYQSFGFIIEGKPYDEDGIPHVQMRLSSVLSTQ